MGLPAVALAFTGLGIGVQAYGQYKSGKAAKKAATTAAKEEERVGAAQREAAESQAALSDYNAAAAGQQAQDAIERGADAESRFRTQVRGIIGTQRANQAAGNINVNWGSSVDVQADAAFLGEMDALQIRTNAAREAWGFKVEGYNYAQGAAIQRKEGYNLELAARARAEGTRAAGAAAETASKFGVASTLLGGTTSLLQMAYAFSKSK